MCVFHTVCAHARIQCHILGAGGISSRHMNHCRSISLLFIKRAWDTLWSLAAGVRCWLVNKPQPCDPIYSATCRKGKIRGRRYAWRHAQSTSTNSAGNNNNSSAHVRRHLCQMEARVAQRRAFDRHVAILHSEAAAQLCHSRTSNCVGQRTHPPTAFPGYSFGHRQPRVYCRVKGSIAGFVAGLFLGKVPAAHSPPQLQVNTRHRLPHGSCGRAPEPTHPAAMPLTH